MYNNNNSDKNENDEGDETDDETNFNNIVSHTSSALEKILSEKDNGKGVKYAFEKTFLVIVIFELQMQFL